MPLRQRERFERSDVPTPSPLRSVVSFAALVLTAASVFFLATTLWRRAHQVDGLNDRALRTSVRAQASVADPPEGFVRSEHDFTNALVLSVAEDGSLRSAQLLVLDVTDGTGAIVDVPLDAKVSVADAVTSLSALFAEQGAQGCVVPLSAAANVHVDDVIVTSVDLWENLERLRGPEMLVLMGSGADVLEAVASNLSPHGLLSLVEEIGTIGLSSLRHLEAPVVPEQLEDGRVLSVIDQTQLGVQTGVLASVEPTPEGEAAEGETTEGESGEAETEGSEG